MDTKLLTDRAATARRSALDRARRVLAAARAASAAAGLGLALLVWAGVVVVAEVPVTEPPGVVVAEPPPAT